MAGSKSAQQEASFTMVSSSSNQGYDLSFLDSLLTAASTLDQQQHQQLQQQGPLEHTSSSSRPSPQAAASSQAACSGWSTPVTPPTRPSVAPFSHSSSLAHIPVDISENDKYIRLRLKVVGVKASDIQVSMQGGILVIRGVRTLRCVSDDAEGCDQQQSGGASSSGILKSHRFCRRYCVDTDVVDITKIRGTLSASGILTIAGPKKNAPISLLVAVAEDEDNDPLLPLYLAPPQHPSRRGISNVVSAASSDCSQGGDEKKDPTGGVRLD